MILPIYAYGQPVLKKVAEDIDKDYPELEELIENMWETLYKAEGIGLAAPQIGRSIRLFLVDSKQSDKEGEEPKGIKEVFINAEILDESGEPWKMEEGCLSIPDVRGDVSRQPQVKIQYQDQNFVEHTKVFDGLNARVIQHEYDHIDGILFTELLKPIKKRLVKKKLEKIKLGQVYSGYKMRFKK